MKKVALSILILLSFTVKSQTKITVGGKNSVHYKSDLISEALIQNYFQFSDKEKVIYDRALGIDVDIYVDTIFKKYTITFLDKDNNKKVMIYNYIRDYFLENKGDNSKTNKLYLMEFADTKFFLIDYLDFFPFNQIEIDYDKKSSNNCTLLFRIKDVKKIP